MEKNVTSRRNFFKVSAGALGAAFLAPNLALADTPAGASVSSPEEALKLLMQGNERYQSGKYQHLNLSVARRAEVAKGQAPFAAVFACADSREAPELIFDRGLGDLFVVRTAGHVLDQAALGSLEYGVAELRIPLIVVMGHERCGAVKATIETLESGGKAPSAIQSLVNMIRPAVQYMEHAKGADHLDEAIKSNTVLTVRRLMRSPIVAEAVAAGKLKVVGAGYDLDTGAVQLLKV